MSAPPKKSPVATKADLERFATNEDLESVRSELETFRGEIRGELQSFAERMEASLTATEERLRNEMHQAIAQHVSASTEAIRTQLRAYDDQYRDLPDRVAALEAASGE